MEVASGGYLPSRLFGKYQPLSTDTGNNIEYVFYSEYQTSGMKYSEKFT